MKIFYYPELENLPTQSVVALGFFDGVHAAHRKLISDAKTSAFVSGVPFGIVTFSSESDIKKDAQRIYSTEERLKLFEEAGADFTVVLDFDKIRDLSPEQFVEKILSDKLCVSVAFAGYNFRFGKHASGSADDLLRLMEKNRRKAVICDEITRDGKTVSATAIRALIENGEIKEANELLCSPYFVSGEVVRGNGKGHALGFPTVNTSLPKGKIVPKKGVYRSLVKVNDRLYNGVTNVGQCPTFDKREVHLETFIIDFSKNIYGENVSVYLIEYLRAERKFDTPEELKMQIEVDKINTIKKNGEEKWQELGLK